MNKLKKQHGQIALRMTPGIYYIWCGGSCDYSSKERESGGAYIMEKDGEVIERYTAADCHATEFRMILTVMLHALLSLPQESEIVFLTNVAYIQNFDRQPTASSANADLISQCIEAKRKHTSAMVKIVGYHKYRQLQETHDMAREAMKGIR